MQDNDSGPNRATVPRGSVFLPVEDLPQDGWWRLAQWSVASRSATEQHPEWYYPTDTDYHAGGAYGMDAHAASTGDFDGDGLMDIIVNWVVFPHTIESETWLKPSILLNRGGYLEEIPQELWPDTLERHFAYHVVTGNFNGDGLDDILIGSMGLNMRRPGQEVLQRWEPAVLAMANTAGGFSDFSDHLEGQTLTQPSPKAFFMHDTSRGDVNGDGIDDVFAGGRLWLSNGSGSWDDKTSAIASVLTYGGPPYASGVGDLTGDGIPDVLALFAGFATQRVVLSSSGGSAPTFQRIDLPPGFFGADNTRDDIAAIADVNRDGLNDIIVGETRVRPYYHGAAVQILIQTSPGVFADETALRIDNSSRLEMHGEAALFVMDANGDGHPDIIHTNSVAADGLAIFLNDGHGYFTLMDRTLVPFLQRSQLQGWEDGLNQTVEHAGDRAYPVHIDKDGILDFVVQALRPLTTWPQAEPSEVALYTLVSNPQAFGRDQPEMLAGSMLADTIYGVGGADTIEGGPGNDVLHGG